MEQDFAILHYSNAYAFDGKKWIRLVCCSFCIMFDRVVDHCESHEQTDWYVQTVSTVGILLAWLTVNTTAHGQGQFELNFSGHGLLRHRCLLQWQACWK